MYICPIPYGTRKCSPSSIYPTHRVVIWNRRELISAVMSTPFSGTRIVCCFFFYSFLNVYLWILTPPPKFLYFCANHNGFYVILFLRFGTSPPIFYLSHHSTFVTLIWNVLLVSLMPKSGTTILCFRESGVQQSCTSSLCEPPSDCALSCLGRAYSTWRSAFLCWMVGSREDCSVLLLMQ